MVANSGETRTNHRVASTLELVFDQFDKHQYQLQLKQLNALKQSSSMVDYHIQFEKLAHGILLYNNAYDDVYFVMRFVARLREDTKTDTTLHCSKDVDTTSALALLQEEELAMNRAKSFGRDFTKGHTKVSIVEQYKSDGEDKMKQRNLASETNDTLPRLENL